MQLESLETLERSPSRREIKIRVREAHLEQIFISRPRALFVWRFTARRDMRRIIRQLVAYFNRIVYKALKRAVLDIYHVIKVQVIDRSE